MVFSRLINMKFSKSVIILVVLSLPIFGFSQRKSNKFPSIEQLRSFDDQKFHFGFSLGYNNSSYKMHRNYINPSLISLEIQNNPGFDIGLVSVYHISKNLKLRFVPTISFQDRLFQYDFLETFDSGSVTLENQSIESTFINLPLLLKLRTNRIKNFAAAVLLGGQYSIDAASDKDVFDTPTIQYLKTQDIDYSMIIGGGFDFFLEYFKLGLELKYNHGFANMLFQDHNFYSDPINSLYSRVWTFTITFEGSIGGK